MVDQGGIGRLLEVLGGLIGAPDPVVIEAFGPLDMQIDIRQELQKELANRLGIFRNLGRPLHEGIGNDDFLIPWQGLAAGGRLIAQIGPLAADTAIRRASGSAEVIIQRG